MHPMVDGDGVCLRVPFLHGLRGNREKGREGGREGGRVSHGCIQWWMGMESV